MALAIDASSPAAVHTADSNATSVTTASFTPPADSILIICGGLNVNSNSGTITLTVTDNLATHLTYTTILQEGNQTNDAWAKAFWAHVTTSAAMTITISEANAAGLFYYPYLAVYVITGANTTNPIGASGGGRGATATISDGYTSTVNNSWGWMVTGDWSAQTLTQGSGETLRDSYLISTQITYGVIAKTSTTATSGTSVTMTTAAPTSGAQISHVYFEIVPSGGAVAPPWHPLTAGTFQLPYHFRPSIISY